MTALAKVDAVAPSWRPLRMRMRVPDAVSTAGLRVADAPTFGGAIAVPPDGRTVELVFVGAGRLEPGAQRLQASAERDQTGEREGGGEGHNSPGHAPRLPGGARRAFTARTQYGTYGRVAA